MRGDREAADPLPDLRPRHPNLPRRFRDKVTPFADPKNHLLGNGRPRGIRHVVGDLGELLPGGGRDEGRPQRASGCPTPSRIARGTPPKKIRSRHRGGRDNEALRSPNARLLYRLPGPTLDGRSVLVPRPWSCSSAWRPRFARCPRPSAPDAPPPLYGVLAPNARLRAEVVALRRNESAGAPAITDDGSHTAEPSPSSRRSARIPWAHLLARGHRREALVVRCYRSCARGTARSVVVPAGCGSSPS